MVGGLTALVLTTLGGILKAALYVYAVEGTVPRHFEASDMERAFRDNS